MPPESIRKFSLFYLGALALNLLGTVVGYEAMTRAVEAAAGPLGSTTVLAGIALNVAIVLLLWFLVARKGITVAKWIVVLLFLFSLLTGFQGLSVDGMAMYEWLGLASLVAQAVAVYYLFQPDSREWFARKPEVAADGEE